MFGQRGLFRDVLNLSTYVSTSKYFLVIASLSPQATDLLIAVTDIFSRRESDAIETPNSLTAQQQKRLRACTIL